jgi:hypothetical protein
MDAARRVARRLERIEALDRRRASPSALLGELRALVREAEALAREDHDRTWGEEPGNFGRGRQE